MLISLATDPGRPRFGSICVATEQRLLTEPGQGLTPLAENVETAVQPQKDD